MSRNKRSNYRDNISDNRDDRYSSEDERNYVTGEYETTQGGYRDRQEPASYDQRYSVGNDTGRREDYWSSGVRSNYGSQGRFDPNRTSYGRDYQRGSEGINRASRWQESQDQTGIRDSRYRQREGGYDTRQIDSGYGIGTEERYVTRWQGESPEGHERSSPGQGTQQRYEGGRGGYGQRQGEYEGRRVRSYGEGRTADRFHRDQGEFESRNTVSGRGLGRSSSEQGNYGRYDTDREEFDQRQRRTGSRQGLTSPRGDYESRYDMDREDYGQASGRRHGMGRESDYRQGSERRYKTRSNEGMQNENRHSSRGLGQESGYNDFDRQDQYRSPNYDSQELQRGYEEEQYGRINEGFENTGNYGQRSESRGGRDYSDDYDNIF